MKYIAIDLGAESGRVMAGILEEDKLQLHRTYPFANRTVRCNEVLYWDFLHLWDDICEGIQRAVATFGQAWDGIGVDTWGVDYGLVGRGGEVLGFPYMYRDSRTDGMMVGDGHDAQGCWC